MEREPLYQVFVRDYARLCALAAGILRDEALAQDAVQESWLRLQGMSGLKTDDREKLRHLVLITVRHTAYNMRKRKVPLPVEDEALSGLRDKAPLPDETVEQRDTLGRLLAAMQRLEETDRAILQLQYGQALSSRQIAGLLGLKPATVRQRARRAKMTLKNILEKEGLTL